MWRFFFEPRAPLILARICAAGGVRVMLGTVDFDHHPSTTLQEQQEIHAMGEQRPWTTFGHRLGVPVQPDLRRQRRKIRHR